MNQKGLNPAMKLWPKEDVINWVQWELQRARFGQDWEKSPIGNDRLALEVWLAKERDGKSWKVIGETYFRSLKNREARRSEARRAHQRVQRYLENPNAHEFQVHRLKRLIEEAFGVSAETFRTFILTGCLPRKGEGPPINYLPGHPVE